MSQANAAHITTRRFFIAGGSAASVFGALAAAKAVATPAGKFTDRALPTSHDPVFAAIDAFVQADAEWKITQDREDELCHSDLEMSRAPRVLIGRMTILDRASPHYNQERPYYLYDEDSILRHTAGPTSTSRDRLLTAFREDAARQEQLQRESGYTEAVRLCSEAFERACALESAALRTVPTSLDGAIALAAFTARTTNSRMDADHGAFEATILTYLQSLRAAA